MSHLSFPFYGLGRNRKRVLVLYKTSPFYSHHLVPRHTNEYEIKVVVKELVKLGFSVDLVDRDALRLPRRRDYSLMLLLGTGPGSKHFEELADTISCPVVMIATHLPPEFESTQYKKHFNNFQQRFPNAPVEMPEVHSSTQFEERLNRSSAVLLYGDKFSLSQKLYEPFGRPIFHYPPTSLYPPADTLKKDAKKNLRPDLFLSYVGKGHVIKGVDLLVEAFARRPNLRLHIYGPENDDLFNRFVRPNLPSNVEFRGFIRKSWADLYRVFDEYTAGLSASPSDCWSTATQSLLATGTPVIGTVETGIPYPGLDIRFSASAGEVIANRADHWASQDSKFLEAEREAAVEFAQTYSPRTFGPRIRESLIQLISLLDISPS